LQQDFQGGEWPGQSNGFGVVALKVLILCHSFPPRNVIGALRPAKCAEVLRDLGHQVHVISSSLGLEDKGMGVPDGITLDRYDIGWFSRFLSVQGGGFFLRNLRKVLRRCIFPDHTWLLRSTINSKLLEQKVEFDLVFSSAFPFVLHQCVLDCKRKNQFKNAVWVADNRDPWTDNPYSAKHGFIWDLFMKRKERAILQQASYVSFTAPSTLKNYEKKHSLKNLLCIMNGYEPYKYENSPVVLSLKERFDFVIAHTGGLYQGKRSMHTLIEACNNLMTRSNCKLCLLMVGDNITDAERTAVKGFEVVHLGRVPLTQSYDIHAAVDCLVLPMDTSDYDKTYLPAKVFEYIRANKPIVCTAQEDSDLASVLDSISNSICTFNVQKVELFMEQLITSKPPFEKCPDTHRRRYSAAEQFSLLESLRGTSNDN
jgi:hypothetical protein